MRRRIYEHMNKKDSLVYRHFYHKHQTKSSSLDLFIEILQSNFANVYERKICERNFIRSQAPEINMTYAH